MTGRGRPRSFDRAQALKRAMELFWRHGYDGVSLTELTAAMGIASPSLYAAFGSKEALYREAIALYETDEGEALQHEFEAAPSARSAIETYLMRSAALFTRQDKPAGCMVVLTSVHAGGVGEDTCRDLAGARRLALALLEERLSAATGSGELPAGIDAAAIASFYVTVQQGMSLRARDGATRAELEAVAAAAMAAWDGLARPVPAQPVRATLPSSG